MTTNLPMIFPLVKRWLRPLLPKQLSASQKVEKSPTDFRTIGGGGGAQGPAARRKPISANALTDFTHNASEEQVGNEVNKEKQHDDMLQRGGTPGLEAGAVSHGQSTVLDTGDAEHEEWSQFQSAASK